MASLIGNSNSWRNPTSADNGKPFGKHKGIYEKIQIKSSFSIIPNRVNTPLIWMYYGSGKYVFSNSMTLSTNPNIYLYFESTKVSSPNQNASSIVGTMELRVDGSTLASKSYTYRTNQTPTSISFSSSDFNSSVLSTIQNKEYTGTFNCSNSIFQVKDAVFEELKFGSNKITENVTFNNNPVSTVFYNHNPVFMNYLFTNRISLSNNLSFGFELDTSTNDYYFKNLNGYVSSSQQNNNSFAVCRISFTSASISKLTLYCVQSSEINYDYGLISNLDTELSLSNTVDSSSLLKKNFKGTTNNSLQTVVFDNIPTGTHFIDIKYRKDSSSYSGTDTFKFKVKLERGAEIVLPVQITTTNDDSSGFSFIVTNPNSFPVSCDIIARNETEQDTILDDNIGIGPGFAEYITFPAAYVSSGDVCSLDASFVRNGVTYNSSKSHTYIYSANYTVTFVANGSTYATRTVTPGSSLGWSNIPSDPSRSGWVFEEWRNGSSYFSSSTTINSNITVTARWRRQNGYTWRDCYVCDGTGVVWRSQILCPSCDGSGMIFVCNACGRRYPCGLHPNGNPVEIPCAECDTLGWVDYNDYDTCSNCNGSGEVQVVDYEYETY